MRVSRVCALFICLTALAGGINFRKVAEFPDANGLRALCFDTDQDGRQNIVMRAYLGPIQFWEHIGYDKYVLEDTARPAVQLYDIGYLDADSLVDMVGVTKSGRWPLYVYESPSQHSHPTSVVWGDSTFQNMGGCYITDLDQDGIKEILFYFFTTTPPYRHTCVYENTDDNQYILVWEDTIKESSYFVHGDFDQDGQIEFVSGNAYGHVHIWECIGNDNYQYIFCDTLPRSANYDLFRANDMDGNGRPEFLFTSQYLYYRRVYLYCYESIEDNVYDYFLIDSVIDLPMGMEHGRSVCGNIDGDGSEEIVWSSTNQWHIYKAFGVHDYQRIYSSDWTQHEITEMNVYDLNENGYTEVIEAWFENGIPSLHAVVIWEIEGVRLHQPNGGEVLNPDQQYLITWEKFDPPGADSFALFYSIDNGFNYDTIITGLASNDTSYLWTVPNTISDSCIVMIRAYGPPRPGEQQPRGIAWDFSDSVFTISNEGIKTDTRYLITDFSLKILPNPFRNATTINFQIEEVASSQKSVVSIQIYNTLGRLVRQWDYQTIRQSDQITWDGCDDTGKPLPSGVYFVRLEGEGFKQVRKVILLR